MTAGHFVVLILAAIGGGVMLLAGWLSLVVWVQNRLDSRRQRPRPEFIDVRMTGLERVVEECPRRLSAEAHELQLLQHYELPDGRLVCSFDDAVSDVRRAGGVPTMAEFARRIERDARRGRRR